jgi:hypothetical protein
VSKDTIFTAGSLAKAYVEIAEWYGTHTADIDAKKICVPFSGFGRMASAMCADRTVMTVCDYQRLHSAIVRGIFTVPMWRTNVDKPRFHKGLAVAGKCIKGMDTYSAGFVDWVAANGTPLDVASIAMSLPGQTYRGYLGNWIGGFDKLWEKFLKTREEFRDFLDMPGDWILHEADLFSLIKEGKLDHYDVIAIDPPRLGSGPKGKDAYSLGPWQRLNETLGGTVKIKPWTVGNYFHLLHQTLSIPSNYILFSWTDSNPPLDDVKKAVLSYGVLEEEIRWDAFQKTFYSWRVKRNVDS